LLKRCLEKDPQQRLRHIGDVMALLDEVREGQSATATSWLWPVAAIVIVAAAALTLVVWAPWRTATSSGSPVRFEVGETERMKFFYGDFMAVSPDGHWMVFPATGEDGVNRYWLRSLETVEARPLPGTETAYVPAAWTSDSRYVIFTLQNSPKLYKADIQGGPRRRTWISCRLSMSIIPFLAANPGCHLSWRSVCDLLGFPNAIDGRERVKAAGVRVYGADESRLSRTRRRNDHRPWHAVLTRRARRRPCGRDAGPRTRPARRPVTRPPPARVSFSS
jgi:hypothetical protein